jgi:Retrotransposon gag protein
MSSEDITMPSGTSSASFVAANAGSTSPQANPQTSLTSSEERAALMRAILQLGAGTESFIDSQREEAQRQALVNDALIERIVRLREFPPDVAINPRGNPRFREPFVFKGKATEVNDFLMLIKDAIHLSRKALPTEDDKCIYMATYLAEGSPRQWYTAVRLKHADTLLSFDQFCEDFKAHFGSSNIQSEASRKINVLYQTGSAATYAARYQELLVHVDWSEATQIDKFYEHLKSAIKDVITLTKKEDRPTEFKAYVDFVIEIDNRVHDRELERKQEGKQNHSHFSAKSSYGYQPHSSPQSFYGQATTPISTSTPTLPPGEPMVIDATKISKPRGPLTAEERERRHKHNLCLYCGGANHTATTCPNMSEASKKRHVPKASAQSGKA